jgi:hypothetical protein
MNSEPELLLSDVRMFEVLIVGLSLEGGISSRAHVPSCSVSGVLDERVLAGVSNGRRFDMKSRSRHP